MFSFLYFFRNTDAALTMGALCIIIGLIYLIDTIVSNLNRNRILAEEKAWVSDEANDQRNQWLCFDNRF